MKFVSWARLSVDFGFWLCPLTFIFSILRCCCMWTVDNVVNRFYIFTFLIMIFKESTIFRLSKKQMMWPHGCIEYRIRYAYLSLFKKRQRIVNYEQKSMDIYKWKWYFSVLGLQGVYYLLEQTKYFVCKE